MTVYNAPMSINKLLKANNTIFSVNDLGLLLDISDSRYLKTVIYRLTKSGVLNRLAKGIYTTKQDWDTLELANKLRTPSYISFETILSKSNIVFQDYANQITSAYTNTLQKRIGDKNYSYYKLDLELLTNPAGLEIQNGITMATPERAICDRLYLTPRYYFDNIDGVNKEKLANIAKNYNKRVQKEVAQLCS